MEQDFWGKKCIVSPSLITLDMCNLEHEAALVKDSGLESLHVDILDGHFSPSMPLGLDTVKQLRKKTDLIFDAHVMTTDPQFYIEELIEAGAGEIVFHIETCAHVDGTLEFIKRQGIRAGVALKPATNLHVLDYVLEKCDAVLLMLINPGFAQIKGEKQTVYAERKVNDLHRMIESRGLDTKVVLDGRISRSDIEKYGRDGRANIFVAGSTCIPKEDKPIGLKELKDLENDINGL
ncbi:MAG: ribulose-phosphate 3-epimerase [Lachnospiraceae bacterium]|nr:ribulose-phosphate 3-epimerase [Lachnospiraceae bacterium]